MPRRGKAAAEGRVSNGVEAATGGIVLERDVMVAARDGVRLATEARGGTTLASRVSTAIEEAI